MLKALIKKIMWVLHLDITRNQQYDRQTYRIMQKAIGTDSVCMDIGCHKGEMLDIMMKFAPKGKFFAFEPLPPLFRNLVAKYGTNPACVLSDVALSNEEGETTFHYVVNAPAYSGIKQRRYDTEAQVEMIKVKMQTLDNLIPPTQKIDFMKVDVEGGEMAVFRGGAQTIARNKPTIIFECGIGASDYYQTQPEDVFRFMQSCGLKISLLKDYLNNTAPLTEAGFRTQFSQNLNYYFVAHP